MNNQTLESYVVERVKKLENEVAILTGERDTLIKQLEAVDDIKAKMRNYFKLATYSSGTLYIDHEYDSKYVQEIAGFIGLEEGQDEHED